VKVGCEGCPFYDHVRRRCSLGYVACYDPLTKTITFSSPEYINELVATHELLHYVLDVYGRRGYRIGIRIGRSDDSVPIFGLAGLVLSLIGLRLAYSAFRKRG